MHFENDIYLRFNEKFGGLAAVLSALRGRNWAAGAEDTGLGIEALGKLVYPIFRRFPVKTMNFSGSSLAGARWRPEGETE